MRIPNRPGGTCRKRPGRPASASATAARVMHFLTRTRLGLIPLSLAAAVAAVAAVPAAASASTGASPVVGYTYVDGNTAPANTIDGFARHADGSLTALPGSPFAAGGAGLGTGLASQGPIQVTSDGRYLLAVDAGSN
jgi:6-phosphogluconolactonase